MFLSAELLEEGREMVTAGGVTDGNMGDVGRAW